MRRLAIVILATATAIAAAERDADPRPHHPHEGGGHAGLGTHRRPAPRQVERAFLGVVVERIDPILQKHLAVERGVGLIVRTVAEDSPAAAAGLAADDILVRLDDQLLVTPDQLRILVRRLEPGTEVAVSYLRAGEEATATATLVAKEVLEWPEGPPHGLRGLLLGPDALRTHCDHPHRHGAGERDVGFSIAIEDGEIVCRGPDGEAFWRAPFAGFGDEAAEVGERMQDAVRERLEHLARAAEEMAAEARERLGEVPGAVEEGVEERFERMQERQEALEERIEELLERLDDEEEEAIEE